LEKETLAAYEGHDADIPSNEGYILDAQGELKQRQSIALSRKASRKSIERNSTNNDVEKAGEAGSTDEDDSNMVWWDGPDDPLNPINFKPWIKTLNICLVSAICFVTPLGSSMFAPGVPELMREFKSSNVELASFVVSVYVLGFAVGPLFFAPLSEIYGRLPVYHACNALFLACNIACALAPNLNFLVGFRFLAGVFGSAPLTNGGGTIADLVTQEKRGKAMSGFVMGPIVGPISESHRSISLAVSNILSRACCWRLFESSQGLEMDVLGPLHALWIYWTSQLSLHERDVCRCHSPTQDDPATGRNWKEGAALQARCRPFTSRFLPPFDHTSHENARQVSNRSVTVTLRRGHIRLPVSPFHNLHACL
jgi:hypothetical protein